MVQAKRNIISTEGKRGNDELSTPDIYFYVLSVYRSTKLLKDETVKTTGTLREFVPSLWTVWKLPEEPAMVGLWDKMLKI